MLRPLLGHRNLEMIGTVPILGSQKPQRPSQRQFDLLVLHVAMN